ncbi:MAG: MarR family transcriptional regulator [Nocardioides sp.]
MAPKPAPVPLARLLALGFQWMITELHERLAAQGWEGVRPSYGFVLLALRDGALPQTELAPLLGISKQAASKLIEAMTDAGLVERESDLADARRQLVRLRDTGHQLLADVEAIYAELEEEWALLIGTTAMSKMRAGLTHALLGSHGGELPALRPLA